MKRELFLATWPMGQCEMIVAERKHLADIAMREGCTIFILNLPYHNAPEEQKEVA